MSLRKTLNTAIAALTLSKIDHALIGGMALAAYGINRATGDVDLLIDGSQKELAKNTLIHEGFLLKVETAEVLHFEGIGLLDVLLAQRPLSIEMLKNASVIPSLKVKCLCVEDLIGLKIQAYVNNYKREYQDKADIRSLIEKVPTLDWTKVKRYADLFQQWPAIQDIQKRI